VIFKYNFKDRALSQVVALVLEQSPADTLECINWLYSLTVMDCEEG
jgi:hypothetical protein